jgi:hypothetical protein
MPLVDRRAMTLAWDWRSHVLVESCSPQQLGQDPANEFSYTVLWRTARASSLNSSYSSTYPSYG